MASPVSKLLPLTINTLKRGHLALMQSQAGVGESIPARIIDALFKTLFKKSAGNTEAYKKTLEELIKITKT